MCIDRRTNSRLLQNEHVAALANDTDLVEEYTFSHTGASTAKREQPQYYAKGSNASDEQAGAENYYVGKFGNEHMGRFVFYPIT